MKTWKKKKNKNQPITLIVIPQTTDKPFSLSISRTRVLVLLSLLVVTILAILLIGYAYFASQADIRNVNRLKNENLSKEQTIQNLGQELDKIKEQQDTIMQKQNEIKKLMGIKKESGSSESPSRGQRSSSIQNDVSCLKLAQSISSELAGQEKELKLLLDKVSKQPQYYRNIPNQWPVYGEISSPYGWRNSPFRRKNSSFHDGIDIKSNSGTPVLAATDGKVTYSGWMAAYGRTIEIKNSSGYTTKYGHNSVLLVKKGDSVEKGQLISRVGNTGLSTGPHLHFTVFKGNETQDPLTYLPLE